LFQNPVSELYFHLAGHRYPASQLLPTESFQMVLWAAHPCMTVSNVCNASVMKTWNIFWLSALL